MNCSDAVDHQLRGVGDEVMDLWRQRVAALLQAPPHLLKRRDQHQEWLAPASGPKVLIPPAWSLRRESADPTAGRLVSLGRGRFRAIRFPCALL